MKISEVIGHIRNAENITFIIGAGASQSAGIPTAPELVKIIEADFSHCLTTLSPTDRKQYGKVMGALSPADRKRLIEPLLERERMNWGHIALANVIQTTEVRRVLSFNFDFLLERAMSLLGSHLPVYDFGVAPSRHITGLADKAVFHLHGQSYGLTLLNTEEETKEHAEKLRPLISDSLRNHLTIVIGYSGEADAAFDIMKNTFDCNNNLIWLGYEKEPSSHLKPLLKMNYADYIGNCDFDLTMLEIARGVGSWPIPIIDNPPAHLLKLLAPLPDFPVTEKEQTAVLTQTRIRLVKNADEWSNERTDAEEAAKALMSGIDETDHVSRETSEEAREIRGWGFVIQGNKLADSAKTLEGEARTQKFTEAYQKYAAALEIKPDMHEALYNWGYTIGDEAKTLEGEARTQKFTEAYEKYAAALEIKPDKHEALYNWGYTIGDEAKTLEGEARTQKFAEAYEKFAAALKIKPDMYEALNNWGNSLGFETETLEGEARTQQFAEAYDKFAAALKIKPDMYEALNNWGIYLGDEAKMLEGEARTQKFAEAYQKYAAALKIKPDMHEALFNWGTNLGVEAETLEGEARTQKFTEAYQKYAAALEIKPDKHEALHNWGTNLGDEAKTLEGEARTQKFAEAYQKYAAALKIKPDNHEALHNWGAILGVEAETLEGEARAQKFAEAYKKYAAALEIKPDNHEALINWGATLLYEVKTLEVLQQAEKFKQANDILLQAKNITGKPNYNYACLMSVTGKTDEALDELEACLAENNLPDVAHLCSDDDLDNLRKMPRFIEIVKRHTSKSQDVNSL